ncbi:unnamed protein product [Notodromas monacha]|uniref:Uncharacterized protein n=1 Tax=Notodromas monacha TaxID=399045 RepID=A0A7R9GK47_9CRUS|nr:unnamed protein product [Notodromas monacha]CAG0924250.1 unnamed protein product [Notodromas monacha]
MPVANKECVRGDGGVSCGPCPQFRHVVVVGNGPSAITLSFMLSGHWPQYNGNPVADPCLQLRLDDTKDFSLMELNLEELSEVRYYR